MTLAGMERRLAARHQDKTFRANDPFWVVFTPEELTRLINHTEASHGNR